MGGYGTDNGAAHAFDRRKVRGAAAARVAIVVLMAVAWCLTPVQLALGAQWRLARATPVEGYLVGVSCPSITFCMAVGANGTITSQPTFAQESRSAFAEQWHAGRWSVAPITKGPLNQLGPVSCVSRSFCMSIGDVVDRTSTLTATVGVQRWNGSVWTTSRLWRAKGGLVGAGISCASRVFCVAVATRSSAPGRSAVLIERWTGRSWSPVRIANAAPSLLTGVSCTSSSECVAVGGMNSYHWNGRRWHVRRMPTRDESLSFSTVSCGVANSCTAVGAAESGDSGTFVEVEHWDGKAWAFQALPFALSPFAGVSCVTNRRCMIVGDHSAPSGSLTREPTAGIWRGAAWSVQPVPAPTLPTGMFASGWLSSVACATQTRCVAVGGFTSASGDDASLIETYR